MPVSVIAGLGNPGLRYRKTRHNAGFIVLDAYARRKGAAWRRENRFEARVARLSAGDRGLFLVKPQTYMNESGRALGPFLRFHRLTAGQMAVIHDEAQIPLGRVKISTRGGAGGHNGIASLFRHAGEDFIRFRVGVGPKLPAELDIKDFMLSRFRREELARLGEKMEEILAGLQLLVDKGPVPAMNQLNQRLKTSEHEND